MSEGGDPGVEGESARNSGKNWRVCLRITAWRNMTGERGYVFVFDDLDDCTIGMENTTPK
jgi:hypothetical protein